MQRFFKKIRNDYSVIIQKNDSSPIINSDKLKFITGANYQYVIDLNNNKVIDYDNELIEIHNLSSHPKKLNDLIDLIHPDDLDFVLYAEEWGFNEMLDLNNFNDYKVTYLIRMKVDEDNYEVFHHQTYYTKHTKSNKIINCIHFNSNYNDIVNSIDKKVCLVNVNSNKIVKSINYLINNHSLTLTKREEEFVSAISDGLTDIEISKKMFISPHTAKTHRRNILSKTNSKNSAHLIKKWLKSGIFTIISIITNYDIIEYIKPC